MVMPSNTTDTPKRLLDAVAEHYRGEWGFTGTRKGMSPAQQTNLRSVMKNGMPMVFSHGGAHGADSEAHAIWREEMRGQDVMALVWPADEQRAVLFQGEKRTRVHPVMPPLDRNREIVKRAMFLVACPHEEQELQRSGTWMTIRIAFALKKPVLILWPSGRCTLCRDGRYQRLELT
jgi:hypothetical protein